MMLQLVAPSPLPQKDTNTLRTVSFLERIFPQSQPTSKREKLEAEFNEYFGGKVPYAFFLTVTKIIRKEDNLIGSTLKLVGNDLQFSG